MKPYALLAAAVLCVGLFAFHKTYAVETAWLDNYNVTDTLCYAHDNTPGLDTCGANYGDWGIGVTGYVAQDISPFSIQGSGFDTFQVSSFDTYMYKGSGGGNVAINLVGYALDTAQFNYLVANGTVPDAIATSTATTFTGGSDVIVKFDFPTPVTDITTDYLVVFATGGNNVLNAQFRTSVDSDFGRGLGFTGLYDGWGDQTEPFPNDRDLMITVYNEDLAGMQFTYPENNTTVNTFPLVITGICDYAFDLYVYDGTTIASSTNSFSSSHALVSSSVQY